MTLLDLIIIICLSFGALIGFKKGFFKSLIEFVGSIIIIVISFMFKNSVSIILYSFLPFFDFGGITILNIVVYEVLAFLIIFCILFALFKVVLIATNVFENILKFTVILGIPSKIGGAIVGLIQAYIYIFIVLYVLSAPVFNFDFINDSKMKKTILTSTPLLSHYINKTIIVMDEFKDLKDKYVYTEDKSKLNLETLDLFLKYDIVSVKSVDKLVQTNKLKIDYINDVLDKYREG